MLFIQSKDNFLNEIKQDTMVSKGYVSENTLKMYSFHLDNLGKFVSKEKKKEITALLYLDITEDDIKDYMLAQYKAGKKESTRNAELFTFKSFFSKMSKKLKCKDICKEIQRIKCDFKRKEHFPNEYKNKIIEYLLNLDENNYIECRNKLYFLLIFNTGMRASEVLSLNIDSIKVTRETFYIDVTGKGNKTRAIPLPLRDNERNEKKEYVYLKNLYLFYKNKKRKLFFNHSSEKALFLSKKGKRLSYNNVGDIFRKYLINLGLQDLGYSIHSIRHTVATNWMDSGVNLKIASRLLGHASMSTTENMYVSDEDKVARDALK